MSGGPFLDRVKILLAELAGEIGQIVRRVAIVVTVAHADECPERGGRRLIVLILPLRETRDGGRIAAGFGVLREGHALHPMLGHLREKRDRRGRHPAEQRQDQGGAHAHLDEILERGRGKPCRVGEEQRGADEQTARHAQQLDDDGREKQQHGELRDALSDDELVQQKPLQAEERHGDDAKAHVGETAAGGRHAEAEAEDERCDHRPVHRAFELLEALRIPRTTADVVAEQHQRERQDHAHVVARVVALQHLRGDVAEHREHEERCDDRAHARAAREARSDQQQAARQHRGHGEQNLNGLAGRLRALEVECERKEEKPDPDGGELVSHGVLLRIAELVRVFIAASMPMRTLEKKPLSRDLSCSA